MSFKKGGKASADEVPSVGEVPSAGDTFPSVELPSSVSPRRGLSSAKRVAIAALLAALGFVIVLLGSVFTAFDLTCVAAAAFTVALAVIELRGWYPWLVYAVTAVLALLICPDRTAAFEYLLFGGLYPICKASFERLHTALSWVVKLSYFNTSLLLFAVLSMKLLHVEIPSGWTAAALVLGANLFFVLFDALMSGVISLYLVKWRRRLGLGEYF